MKRSVFLLLLALLLIPAAQIMAQTPQATASSVMSAAPVPADAAEFLATLAGGPIQVPSDLNPAPSFLAGCTSDAQCPKGKLCCFPCGADIDGCTKTCLTPVRNHCPLFV